MKPIPLFTQRTFPVKAVLLLMFFLSGISTVYSQVKVTSAGTTNLCLGGAYVDLGSFTVAEQLNNDFLPDNVPHSYSLDAPANFQFNPGSGDVTIPASTDFSFANITVTSTRITILYYIGTTTHKDSFIVSGVEVKAINSTSSNDLRFTAGGAVSFMNNNNYNQYVHAHFNSTQANVSLNLGNSLHNVCVNSGNKTLTGGSPSGGTYSGTGVTGTSFSTSSTGTFTITYTASQNGCTASATDNIVVNSLPNVTLFGVGNSYCNNENDVTLSGFPSGGTFSGAAVTGNIFKPNTLLAGNTSVNYSYTDPSTGCSNTFTKSGINILQAPSVTITLNPSHSTYPTSSSPVAIEGTQSNPSTGGTITVSGNGVSNITKQFSPSQTGEGTFNITRTLVAPNGCSASATKSVTVANSDGVQIAGLAPKYCFNDASSGISSTGLLGGGGTFSGPGITDVNTIDGTAQFTPSLVVFSGTSTTITITFDFDFLGYALQRIQSVTIYRPSATIEQDIGSNSTNFRTQFCGSDGIVVLKSLVDPLGGTINYTGSGVVGSSPLFIFNPAVAANTNVITLNYTDLNGCTANTTATAYVYAKPTARFSISSFCEGDTIQLRDDSPPVNGGDPLDVINKWNWKIDNTLFSKASIDTALKIGNHIISFTTTTAAGCADTLTKSVFIGPYPAISFSWVNVCDGNITDFKNATSIPEGSGWIDSIRWQFSSPDGTDITLKAINQNPATNYWNYSHQFAGPGIYTITQTATTNLQCTSKAKQKLYILPSVTPTETVPYSNDFEVSEGGWVSSKVYDSTGTSWEWGMAAKTNQPGVSHGNIWTTNLKGSFKTNEHSYVFSPCFTVDQLTRPMLSFDIWSLTTKNLSGANIQYSTDGVTWKALGDNKGEGINWYNNQLNISSKPSGDLALNQDGWTDTLLWRNARHVLDDIDVSGSNGAVRFRISFAGGIDTTYGFAFDNFWLGERDRLILAEHFTNTFSTATVSSQENNSINTLVDANAISDDVRNVVALEYHTPFSGPDPLYSRNIPDAGARSLYYGVTQTPTANLDGSYYSGSGVLIDQKMINTRTLYDPAFSITLNPTLSTSTNSVSGTVTLISKVPVPRPVTVYISVVERFVNNIPDAAGTAKNYQWVHTKFLPDAAGTSYAANWTTGQTQTVPFSWNYTSADIYDPSRMVIIAFVQDNVTKEIYQTAYKAVGSNAVTPIFDPSDYTSTVSLYPNPANDITTVILSGKVGEAYNWVVTDELGRTLAQGNLQDQVDGFTINTQSFPSGFYTLRLSNDKAGVKTQKFVVVH